MVDIEIPVGKRSAKYRFFEMLPAICTYSLLALPIVLSIINPLYAAVFIVAYITWWFVKAIGMAYRTVQGYRFMERAKKVDWLERLNDLDEPDVALKKYDLHADASKWRQHEHYRNLQKALQIPEETLKPRSVYNAVIIPYMTADKDVLEPSIKALLTSEYDVKNNFILILTAEQRAPGATALGERLVKRYKDSFFHMEVVEHPFGLPNELIGKGGNLVWGAEKLELILKKMRIDPELVLVTTLDEDHRVHAKYFAAATYSYCIDPQRNHRAYQPITLFLNNIWDAPAPMRVLATGNSFWNIINSMRPHMLRNFASHSQGMASLIGTNFWSKVTIVEDGHQYWRSYFAFDGNYEVTPVYVPIYHDAVLAGTYRKTLREQFIQLRRWAYGASDVAYVADKGFRKDRNVPFWGLLTRFLRLLESHVSWATAPLIITFGAWVPLIFNPEASRSLVAHELPQVASQLQTVAMAGLFITVFLAFKMLPKRPERYKRHRNILMVAQWLLMPVVSILYGSTAAFYSQTRLLLGRYLERFDATIKAVKK
jgi:hypothetical protein